MLERMGLREIWEDGLPSFIERHGESAARAQAVLELPPLTISVGDITYTLDSDRRRSTLCIRRGRINGSIEARMDAMAFTRLLAELRTTEGLLVGGAVVLDHPDTRAFVEWDYVLRALLDGRPVHEAGSVTLDAELVSRQPFGLEVDDGTLGQALHEVGFLHLRSWVDEGTVREIAADVCRAVDCSTRDDPTRWWATLADGSVVCVRVQGFYGESPAMASLIRGPQYERLRRLPAENYALAVTQPASVEALLKPVGVVSGLADFPWHADCSVGGHGQGCAGLVVGLALDAAEEASGRLSVVAGSHRTSLPHTRVGGPGQDDLPIVTITMEPGDLTVHLSCTLHRSESRRQVPRRVVYSTYHLATSRGEGSDDDVWINQLIQDDLVGGGSDQSRQRKGRS